MSTELNRIILAGARTLFFSSTHHFLYGKKNLLVSVPDPHFYHITNYHVAFQGRCLCFNHVNG